jgi:antitoxin component of MazEF toxin-antitoxin module
MKAMHFAKRLRRWGNSYGIALSKAEIEALHAAEGDVIEGEIAKGKRGIDLAGLTTHRLGGRDIDEVLAEEALGRG